MTEEHLSQKSKYATWIKQYDGDIYRKCVEVSQLMQEAFPELTRVKGHVRTIEDLSIMQPHWWLTDPEGNILDPTARQWQCIMEYIPYKEGDLIPVGRCMNCGNQIFGRNKVSHVNHCSDECLKVLEEAFC